MSLLTRISITTLALVTLSCESDKPKQKELGRFNPGSSIWVLNEGGFQVGNASIGQISTADSNYQAEYFKQVNQRPLGDVLQSATEFNEAVYLVVNNSQKIEVVNPQNMQSIKTIGGFQSPRYFLGVNDSIAYVSDLYADAISVVNLNTGTTLKQIKTSGWTEQLLAHNGFAYIAQPESDYLLQIDLNTHTVADSFALSYGVSEIVMDQNKEIWALCIGDAAKNIKAGLHRFNPATGMVELSLELDANYLLKGLQTSPEKDRIYFLSGDVQSLHISETSLPSLPFYQANGAVFYGLGVHPATGDIWLTNAKDFVQQGSVMQLSKTADLQHETSAGVIPNGFYFVP